MSSFVIGNKWDILWYVRHSLGVEAKLYHGVKVLPPSFDLISDHTPGLGELAALMIMYATW